MIKRYISIFIVLFTASISVTHAADDPMKSLFLFQKQMADKGNSSAMMKLGEMYERGDGVAQSNANALKMYEKAKAANHKGADAAIQRIKSAGDKSAAIKKREELERKKAEEAKHREEMARRKAEEEQRQQAEKEKSARENAEKQRLAKLKAEKLRAEQKKNAAAKAAAAKAIAQKAAAQKAAAIKAAAEEAKAKQALIQAEKKRRQEEQTTSQDKNSAEGFKSDPCKSPAARLLSICKKK